MTHTITPVNAYSSVDADSTSDDTVATTVTPVGRLAQYEKNMSELHDLRVRYAHLMSTRNRILSERDVLQSLLMDLRCFYGKGDLSKVTEIFNSHAFLNAIR